MFTRGVEKQEGFRSFTFPSNVSPFFPREEWESARRELPEIVFRQEYMAEFLEDSAGVFRGVEACTVDEFCHTASLAASVSHRVVIGLDLAKHSDWTVLVAIDALTGACLDFERFNQIDWPFQKERIVAFVKRWRGGQLVMDATGIGDPIYDDLCRVLPSVQPYRLTGPSKRELIQGLMVAIEQRDVTWPRAWEILTGELKRYEYEMGPTGNVSYNAPSGYHDDSVIALALAVYGRGKFGVDAGSMRRFLSDQYDDNRGGRFRDSGYSPAGSRSRGDRVRRVRTLA
jgi:hypothetical protein